MKKLISLILALIMLGTAALALVACSDNPGAGNGGSGNGGSGDSGDGSGDSGDGSGGSGDGSGDSGDGSDEVIFVVDASIANAYGGANGIVCLMTDNDSGKFETLALLDELYIEYGLVGGLGTVVKNLYSDSAYTKPKTAEVAKWQEFLDTGRWKIVNHSMTHTTYCDFVDGERVVNSDRLYSELVLSAEKLRELFPDQRVLTYAMTGTHSALGNNASSDPDNIREFERQLIAQYYIGGRFKNSGATAFDALQWNNLPYGMLSRSNLAGILNNIDKAATEGKYYMVYNHYVIEDELFSTVNESSWTNYSTAKALCERVSQYVKSGKLWNAHFEDAIMYMRERATASMTVGFEDGIISVLLTDEMDDEIYNHALTVKLTVPEDWAAVKITQNGNVSYAAVKNDGYGNYVYANITPDLGEATAQSIALSELPEVNEPEVKPTPDIGKPSTPATNPVPDVYTFDTLDGYLGGAITFDNAGVISSKVSVVTEGDGKVLKMEKPEGETNPIIHIKGKAEAGAQYYVFETKIKIERTSSGGEIYIGLVDSKLNFAYRGYIQISSGKISFTDYRSGDSAKAVASNIATAGEWIDLKLVYTVSGGVADITIYIGGTEVLKSSNHYVASSAPIAADQIAALRINLSQKYLGNLYMDDLSLSTSKENPNPNEPEHTHEFVSGECSCGEIDPSYTPDSGEHTHEFVNGKCSCGEIDPSYTPDSGEHTHEFVNGECSCGETDPSYTPDSGEESSADYTFDTLDGYLGDSIVFDNHSADTNKVSIVTEGDEKLIKLEKPSGSTNPSIAFSAKTTSGASSVIVEMDMRIDMTSSSGEIYISLAKKDGYTYAYRTYIQLKSDGTANFADYSKGTGKLTNTVSGIDVSKSDPFKIKMVYTTASDGSVSITTYINNILISTSTNYYNLDSAAINASSVEKLRVNTSASFTGSLLIDNLTLRQIAE